MFIRVQFLRGNMSLRARCCFLHQGSYNVRQHNIMHADKLWILLCIEAKLLGLLNKVELQILLGIFSYPVIN